MKHIRTPLQVDRLEAERAQLLVELARLRETLKTEVDPDTDEATADVVEQELAMALLEGFECRLASIDYALRQTQGGTYGVCERCGEPIDPARLNAIPEATLCLKCKAMSERQARFRVAGRTYGSSQA